MHQSQLCIYILTNSKRRDFVLDICSQTKNTFNFQIFTQPFECTKKLYEFEPELVFIEDSLFDQFYRYLKNLPQNEFSFTFKRCVVFSLEKQFSESRLLELSLFGIRTSFFGLKNFQSHLKAIIKQVLQFQKNRPKISLCLAGGGLDGYMYSLGVCVGLERCLIDFQMQDCDIFCGVSSGAILASCFAGGVYTSELLQQAYKTHPKIEPLSLRTIFDFALMNTLKDLLRKKVPTAFFKGQKLKQFFARQISTFGLEDNLEAIKKDVYIFATDQDTGETVVFGQDPWKKGIKISQAIRASTALPPFYLSEEINGHWFTDGQLATNIEFDLPIHEKSSLVFVIDPIVAFSTTKSGGVKSRGGYFTTLQAIKSLVHSRSQAALHHARDKHPDVDFIKMQPTHEIMDMMSGNPMRIPVQTRLIEMSAQATCEQILSQYDFFQHKFAKHGVLLKSPNEIKLE